MKANSQHAQNCAKTIKEYWLSRGFAGIKTWVYATPCGNETNDREPRYNIRSNLGPNGYPPRDEVLSEAAE